jgi:predicted acetyltransferase
MCCLELVLCTNKDLDILAELNKQLIEDEKSDNKMTVPQLEQRMYYFIHSEHSAYLFKYCGAVIGYALVNYTKSPMYMRQFFICREYRRRGYGTLAFNALIDKLAVDTMEVEALYYNERARGFWRSLGFKERSVCMRRERG